MKCTRCNGIGYVEKYAHIMNGRCFRCLGTGIDPIEMDMEVDTSNVDDGIIDAYNKTKECEEKIVVLKKQKNQYTYKIYQNQRAGKDNEKLKDIVAKIDNDIEHISTLKKEYQAKRYDLIQNKKALFENRDSL